MIRRSTPAVVLLTITCLPVVLSAEPKAQATYKVIVHPSSPVKTITRRDLARIFLKKTTKWPNGTRIRPVDLPLGSHVRRSFTFEVLARSVGAVRSHWQQLIFSGTGVPPAELANDRQVIEHVLSVEGAIGYVSVKARIGKARVVVVE